MYSPTRPRGYEGNGRIARTQAITRRAKEIEQLKAIEAAHTANSAMDVVELLQDLPGFYLWGIRENFKRVQKEIEDLGFPKIADVLSEQVEALSKMENDLRRARDSAHDAYRKRQAEIISASLSSEARKWLKNAPISNGALDARQLSPSVRNEVIGHHLFHDSNGTGWLQPAFLGRDVIEKLEEQNDE